MKLWVEEVKNLKEKIVGLIGKHKPTPILIKTRFGIHTFGLKFPIDVVILDKDNKVVTFKEDLRPGKIFLWNPRHDKVLELPVGMIKEKKIKIGEMIEFKS